MNFTAEIDIMPHKELLDPQGKAVASGLQKLSFNGIIDVRVGRHITLHLEAADKKQAEAVVEEACKKLLANAIMEGYTYTIKEAK
jgi:phosphoribosylformylglycinamidine synthase PurS subunit